LIRRLASGRTVILSTHILQEVEAAADRIVIINRGRIVGDGTLQELRERAKKHDRAEVSVRGERNEIERLLSGLEGTRRVHFLGETDGFASFQLLGKPGSQQWREIGKLARLKGWELRELTERPLSLEETFLALTEPETLAKSEKGEA